MIESPEQKEYLAKFISALMDKYSDKLWKGVKSVYKKASEETRINWRIEYEKYLHKSLNKYFYAKTFLSYNEPRPLYDLFVPLSVSCNERILEKTSITDLIEINKFSIIMATGGSGKTMIMRHLFVDTITNKKIAQVPIFVELRELNDSTLDLFGLIKKKLKDNDFDFGDEYIEKAFEAGHFLLLLDGFDEISDAKRDDTVKQINEIADKYEKNYIVISSRPDISLSYWMLFNVWRVRPLNLDLACELVEKAEAEEEIKEKFIKALNDELFEKHESFLSNPLLLAIMLITYKDTANIPEKISTFYERAFTALFDQHDAKKSFDRKKRSNLDILDFKKVFSAFCFFSFKDQFYSFSDAKVFEYLEKAQKATGIQFEKKDFLHDAIQSVCLLIRDGLEITFSHRSFQEYFTAVFISQLNNPNLQQNFLNQKYFDNNKFFKSMKYESFIDLLFEISPETIEKYLIIPTIEEIEQRLNYKDNLTEYQYKSVFTLIFKSLSVHVEIDDFEEWSGELDIHATINFAKYSKIYRFIRSHYNKQTDISLDNKVLAKLFLENFDYHVEVDIDKVFENKDISKLLLDGNTWLSKNNFQKIFDIKKQLVEKHQKQEEFLEEELFS